MDKVIKEFKNKDLVYQLGYNLYYNKVYPRIEIYKNDKLLSGGFLDCGAYESLFYFYASNSSSYYSNGTVDTIKEMFIELRKYNEIPKEIGREYEELFIIYKLNDFNEI